MADELAEGLGRIAYQWYGYEIMPSAPPWESLSPAMRAGWDTLAWSVILAYSDVQAILEHQGTPTRPDDRQAWALRQIIAATERAIAEFGYEAVYFGVACAVFPEAVYEGDQ